MKNILSLIILLWGPFVLSGQQLIDAYEYWFDDSYSTRIHTPVPPSPVFTLNAEIECNTLSPGVHTFNFRSRQDNGIWSCITSQMFYILPDNVVDNHIINCEYWLDESYNDRIIQNLTPAALQNLTINLDYNTLFVGIHVFNSRFKQTNGQWSSVVSQLFFKSPIMESDTSQIIAYEYWLDNSYDNRIFQNVSPTGILTLASEYDLDTLSNGIHTFNFRSRQNNGSWSSTLSQLFCKEQPSSETNQIVSYEYWFNSDFDSRNISHPEPAQIITTNHNLAIDTVTRFINVFNARYGDRNGAWNYVDNSFYSLNLNLKLFLEGLNDGTAHLHPAMNENGPVFSENIADTLTLEIYEDIFPYPLILRFNGVVLNTDGTCLILGSGSNFLNYPNASNNSYYLVVKHRNSIETWSQAISLSSHYTYDFTTSSSQAFGSNMKLINGFFYLFGGDVNHDGLVDSGDMIPIDNLSSQFGTGYLSEDANGDGLIDSGDMIIVDNNSSDFISVIKP